MLEYCSDLGLDGRGCDKRESLVQASGWMPAINAKDPVQILRQEGQVSKRFGWVREREIFKWNRWRVFE